MSHHRLFAQLAFERALGMAALNALAQAVAECDQFRAVGRERDPIHFWVLAGELEDVVQDRIRDVLDGPGLAVVERGELFHQPRIVELVIAARDARTAPSSPPAHRAIGAREHQGRRPFVPERQSTARVIRQARHPAQSADRTRAARPRQQ